MDVILAIYSLLQLVAAAGPTNPTATRSAPASASGALASAQPHTTLDTLATSRDSLRAVLTLQPITVTAARAERDLPAGVTQVAPGVLQKTPATDAYDLLRQSAGIEAHLQGQGPGFASDASVRGFSSDHSTDIALWVDGVPNNEPVNGHAEGYNDWNLLFPEAIAGIDVLKGPTSALYGNFALSGVVNVQTIDRLHGTTAWLETGSYGHVDGVVLTGYEQGSGSGVFGLRGVREDGWRPNRGYSLGQAHARVVHDLSKTASLDAGIELYTTKWDSPGFLSDSAFQAGSFDQVENPTDGGYKHRAQERVSLRVAGGSSLLWRTTVYATQGRWQLFLTIPPEPGAGEGTGSQTEEEDSRYGFGATSALSWYLAHAQVTAGAEGRWDHSRYENWLTTDRVRDTAQTLVTARQVSGALFVQSSVDVGSHLRLTLGGRWDEANTRSAPDSGIAVSEGHGVLSPKAGVLYRLGRDVGLYGNLSRGFRQTDGVIVDPSLPFITAWAYETGVKLDGRLGNASVALFRMDVSNEQTFDPVTASSTSGGSSRRQGIELDVHVTPTKGLSVGGDWTFNDARYRQLITTAGDTLSGARVFNTARYVGTITLEVEPPRASWYARLSSNIVGPYSPFGEPGTVLPPYGLFHLSGGFRAGSLRLELGVRNLLDRAYPELRAGGFVSPGQPRSVYGTVEYGLP